MAARKIKVQSKYRQLTYGQKFVPELRLCGLWLEQSGFKIGEQVRVTIKDHEIIIKPTNSWK